MMTLKIKLFCFVAVFNTNPQILGFFFANYDCFYFMERNKKKFGDPVSFTTLSSDRCYRLSCQNLVQIALKAFTFLRLPEIDFNFMANISDEYYVCGPHFIFLL